jgi:lysophospholipase L1-like esterase
MRITSTSGVVQVYWDDVIVSRLVEHAESSAFAIDRTDLPIVMLGDSWGLAMHEMLGAALTARSGSPVTVINAAVSGQRLDQMVARFAADVLPHNPGTVVAQYGANDLAASRSQALMEADVDALIALCRSNGIRAVISGIPPITSVLATAVVRNDQIRQRVMRHAV